VQTENQSETKSENQPSRATAATLRAKVNIDASAAKTLTILQDALDKAPDSVKPSLSAIIEHTRTSNARFNRQPAGAGNSNSNSDNSANDTDKHPPVKPKFITPPTMVPSDNTSRIRGNNRFFTNHGNASDNSSDDTDDSSDSDNATMINPPAINTVSASANDPVTVTASAAGSVTVKQAVTFPTLRTNNTFVPNPGIKFTDQTNTSK
jgi:hypothetical protein